MPGTEQMYKILVEHKKGRREEGERKEERKEESEGGRKRVREGGERREAEKVGGGKRGRKVGREICKDRSEATLNISEVH